jgi:putative SOS response-associated peptidase YedK
MCGRFVLVTDVTKITEEFAIEKMASDFQPNWNISPGQYIPVVVQQDGQNILESFLWGLIPSWAKDSSVGNKMFNARAETIAEKPSFKNAFQKRRCLIPADGFYEWQKLEKMKKPFRFSLKSEKPFGLAGLYETWISPEKKQINTCTIITTDSNELIQSIHNRMPVIVKKELEDFWIDPDNNNKEGLLAILKPYSSEEMTISPVDPNLLIKPKAL